MGYRYWEIYIDGDDTQLDKINHVRYDISDTNITPNTVTKTDRKEKFRYSVMSSDSTKVNVIIFLTNKTEPIVFEGYFLNIRESNLKGTRVDI